MEKVIGMAFEDLDQQEMVNIQGGATPTPSSLSLLSFSSAPCSIGAGIVSLVSLIGATIYVTVN